jgi:hypothetical protein
MDNIVKPTTEHIQRARNGIMIQYNAMFDTDTRVKMAELGIDKFIDYAADRIANEEACTMFYSSFLHPRQIVR